MTRRSLACALAMLAGVQCSDGPTGLRGDDLAMVGRIQGAPYEGDASALVVQDVGGSPDSLIIWGMRPRNAPGNSHEILALRIELDGPITARSYPAGVEITHLVGGDVIVGGYNGTTTVILSAFAQTDSILEGAVSFTASNASSSPGRYGSTVTFTDGAFRARVRRPVH